MAMRTETVVALEDELTKIAGYLRVGRRPFKAATLMAKKTLKLSDIIKHSSAPLVGSAVIGALGWEALRRANRDRKLGQAIRSQQQGRE